MTKKCKQMSKRENGSTIVKYITTSTFVFPLFVYQWRHSIFGKALRKTEFSKFFIFASFGISSIPNFPKITKKLRQNWIFKISQIFFGIFETPVFGIKNRGFEVKNRGFQIFQIYKIFGISSIPNFPKIYKNYVKILY